MSQRIYFDGLNLSLERGTGIATYTRMLAGVARDLGYEIGVVYSSSFTIGPGFDWRAKTPAELRSRANFVWWAVSSSQTFAPLTRPKR